MDLIVHLFNCLVFSFVCFGLDFLREEGLVENHIVWGGVGRKIYGQYSHIYQFSIFILVLSLYMMDLDTSKNDDILAFYC